MALWKRGKRYWTRFAGPTGEMFHKPLRPAGQSRGTTSWQEAVKLEKEMIRAAFDGKLSAKAGPTRLFAACDAFLEAKRTVANRQRTADFLEERLERVKKILGDILLVTITRETIEGYQAKRKLDGVSNRTVNMDVGALRQVLKRYKHWRRLEDDVTMLTEAGGEPIGRALTNEEEQRLMTTAQTNPEWEHVWCAAQLAANTSLRGVEVKFLRRKDVDVEKAELKVRHSKNETSYRRIPLNGPALEAVLRMVLKADALGHKDPDHYLWCASQHHKYNPTKPAKKWDGAWHSLRDAAGLPGFRFHDLRHTVVTRLLEAGEPDHVVESITGHLSKRMLQHYSHIRMAAKKAALDRLDESRKTDPALKAVNNR
jgi:integrase